MLPVNRSVIGKALFEIRPYIEYWDRLKEVVEELSVKASDEEDLVRLLEEKILKAEEPFKTDLKIFHQKLNEILNQTRKKR